MEMSTERSRSNRSNRYGGTKEEDDEEEEDERVELAFELRWLMTQGDSNSQSTTSSDVVRICAHVRVHV